MKKKYYYHINSNMWGVNEWFLLLNWLPVCMYVCLYMCVRERDFLDHASSDRKKKRYLDCRKFFIFFNIVLNYFWLIWLKNKKITETILFFFTNFTSIVNTLHLTKWLINFYRYPVNKHKIWNLWAVWNCITNSISKSFFFNFWIKF